MSRENVEKKAIELIDKFGDKAIDVVREVRESHPTTPHNPNTHEEVSEWNEDADEFWYDVAKYILNSKK